MLSAYKMQKSSACNQRFRHTPRENLIPFVWNYTTEPRKSQGYAGADFWRSAGLQIDIFEKSCFIVTYPERVEKADTATVPLKPRNKLFFAYKVLFPAAFVSEKTGMLRERRKGRRSPLLSASVTK